MAILKAEVFAKAGAGVGSTAEGGLNLFFQIKSLTGNPILSLQLGSNDKSQSIDIEL